MGRNDRERVAALIRKSGRIVLTTHVHPDGDAIGSEIGLYYGLKGLGKEVRAVNSDPTQSYLRFVDPEGVAEVFGERHLEELTGYEALVCVDTSARPRIGRVAELLRGTTLASAVIDHHLFEPAEAFAELNWVDESASSAGEMVFDLLRTLACPLTYPVALALYVAIYTDTGGFVYRNTSARTHRAAAELLECGVNPERVRSKIYEKLNACELDLFREALKTLRFECDGRVAWMVVSQDTFRLCSVDPEETEYFLQYIRNVNTVDVIVLFREVQPGVVRVSLRSKSGFNVNRIAAELGGGGHLQASGALVREPLREVVPRVVALVVAAYKKREPV